MYDWIKLMRDLKLLKGADGGLYADTMMALMESTVQMTEEQVVSSKVLVSVAGRSWWMYSRAPP